MRIQIAFSPPEINSTKKKMMLVQQKQKLEEGAKSEMVAVLTIHLT